jgi:hypothetical protein
MIKTTNKLSNRIVAYSIPLKSFIIIIGLFLLIAAASPLTHAQTESTLTISLTRSFGSAIGSGINGTFTLRANGPDDLENVTYYLDGDPMGTVTASPFKLSFNTNNYPSGTHTITATGTTSIGQELQSNSFTRNFLTSSENIQGILFLVVPLVLLIIVGRYFANWISKRGKHTSPEVAGIDGPQGGTICPKCHKPFARHWWAPNLVTSKYDRCPYCHKWSMVTRQPPELLQAAFEAMKQAELPQTSPSTDNDEDMKRRLDDSRFES